MKKSDWQKITMAKDLLELDDKATLRQIKEAYRRLSKKHHPDLCGKKENAAFDAMTEINAAYKVLLDYCQSFYFPLTQENSDQPLEAEDWWMDRFGADPLWGKKQ